MKQADLQKIVDDHGKWMRGEGGAGANLADAYLVGANLADAYLAGANLVGANLAGANLADAYLTGANLTGANLTDAYLVGTNLADANLAGANLADAYLAGAKLDAGEIASWLQSGAVLSYSWNAWRMKDGSVRLRYGCEEHTLDEWPGLLRALCRRHEPKRAFEYERALGALLTFCGALAEPDPDAERGEVG